MSRRSEKHRGIEMGRKVVVEWRNTVFIAAMGKILTLTKFLLPKRRKIKEEMELCKV